MNRTDRRTLNDSEDALRDLVHASAATLETVLMLCIEFSLNQAQRPLGFEGTDGNALKFLLEEIRRSVADLLTTVENARGRFTAQT